MSEVRDLFPAWEDLVADIIEESGYAYFYLPEDDLGDYWELDNEFYRDKHGRLVDDWIFTFFWTDEDGIRYFDKIPSAEAGYRTLDEALHAKIFNGESIRDLYERDYDWNDNSEEWYTDEEGNRIPRKYELTSR